MAVPAFVNPHGGSAEAALEVLRRTPGLDLHVVEAHELGDAVRAAAASGVDRVIVCGGDGSLAEAAAALAGTEVALGVVPGGTRNHFARDHGIPTDPAAALHLALTGTPRPVDAGEVNGRLFLNTSSVGAYVRFVYTRERLEPRLGYWLASALAALRVLVRLPRIRVLIQTETTTQRYRTSFVFVGVGERSLTPPAIGSRVEGAARALQIIVPRHGLRSEYFSRDYLRLAEGRPPKHRGLALDRILAATCRVELHRPLVRVSVDGEIIRLHTPLTYRLVPDALRVVM